MAATLTAPKVPTSSFADSHSNGSPSSKETENISSTIDTPSRSLAQKIGDAYFRPFGTFLQGSEDDDTFGKSISTSDDGNVLAVIGNV